MLLMMREMMAWQTWRMLAMKVWECGTWGGGEAVQGAGGVGGH